MFTSGSCVGLNGWYFVHVTPNCFFKIKFKVDFKTVIVWCGWVLFMVNKVKERKIHSSNLVEPWTFCRFLNALPEAESESGFSLSTSPCKTTRYSSSNYAKATNKVFMWTTRIVNKSHSKLNIEVSSKLSNAPGLLFTTQDWNIQRKSFAL